MKSTNRKSNPEERTWRPTGCSPGSSARRAGRLAGRFQGAPPSLPAPLVWGLGGFERS